MTTALPSLLIFGLSLGLRHGIDWDHIAVISDISSSTAPRRGFLLSTCYALGHMLVVLVLGALAIWFGALLPSWVDLIIGRLVGLTLVAFGIWLLLRLLAGQGAELRSRWMLIGGGMRRLWRRLTGHQHRHGHDVAELARYGTRSALGLGILHGLGAETGTQVLLFASASGIGSTSAASALLLMFALGLLLSNTAIAALALAGAASGYLRGRVQLVLGATTAIYSLILGLLFLSGAEGSLPDMTALFSASIP